MFIYVRQEKGEKTPIRLLLRDSATLQANKLSLPFRHDSRKPREGQTGTYNLQMKDFATQEAMGRAPADTCDMYKQRGTEKQARRVPGTFDGMQRTAISTNGTFSGCSPVEQTWSPSAQIAAEQSTHSWYAAYMERRREDAQGPKVPSQGLTRRPPFSELEQTPS